MLLQALRDGSGRHVGRLGDASPAKHGRGGSSCAQRARFERADGPPAVRRSALLKIALHLVHVIPRHSMYAIYACIDPPNHPNVSIYGIHGVFGIYDVIFWNMLSLLFKDLCI